MVHPLSSAKTRPTSILSRGSAVENAKKSSRVELHIGKLPLPKPPKPEVYRRYFQDLTIPRPDLEQWSEKKDQVLEELTQQMKQLQKRIEQLEQGHQEALRKLLDRNQQDSEDNDGAATGSKVPLPEAEPAV
jgi:TolA-binding protein